MFFVFNFMSLTQTMSFFYNTSFCSIPQLIDFFLSKTNKTESKSETLKWSQMRLKLLTLWFKVRFPRGWTATQHFFS